MMPTLNELKSQLDHLVSQIQSSIADPVRSSDLREAIARSKQLLKRCDGRATAE
jgi:chemotaxis regulatin CheY-phosphate phosphatase CheZ